MHTAGGQASDNGKEANSGERAAGPDEDILMTGEAGNDNLEVEANLQMANLDENNGEPQDPAAVSAGLEDESTSKMAWSPTKIIGHKRTLDERPREEEESDVDELDEDEEEEEEGSEEDTFELAEGECEPWENDARAENKTAEAAHPETNGEGEESFVEGPGSKEIIRLVTPADKGSEQQIEQGPEKLAVHGRPLTRTSSPQQPRCWPGAELGTQHWRSEQGPSKDRSDNEQLGEDSLQVQRHGQAGSPGIECRSETNHRPREEREAERGIEGGSERRLPSPEIRKGQTALHREGDQEASRLGAAELHQRTVGIQGHQGDKDGFQPLDVEMIEGTVPPPRGDYYHAPHTLSTEVILETQLNTSSRGKGSIYNDILASIGLDSPTPSIETRREEDSNSSPRAQLINTPIRNSASSLIALGKHVLTPRQGRIWELRNKSPLGGQGGQFGGTLP